MQSFLESITLKDLIYFLVSGITILSVIVEKSKNLPFHPWTHLFEWVGKCLTNDIKTRLSSIEEQQKISSKAIYDLDKKVELKFKEKQRIDDEKESKRLRANIMSFADSCRVGNKHTQAHFENVMRDYSDYMAYCNKHDFLNHFIDGEYEYISGIYQKCLRENNFL